MTVSKFSHGCGWHTAVLAIGLAMPSALTQGAGDTTNGNAKGPAKTPAASPPPKVERDWLVPIREATALRKAGKLDGGLEVLRKANREIKLADGEESPHLLPVNNLAAELLVDQGNLEAAEALVEKTTSLHEKLLAAEKISPESIGSTLLVSANIDALQKRFLAAIDKVSRALPLLEKLDGPKADAVARGSNMLEHSVENLERLLGPADTMTSDARAKAAAVFEALGRLEQAVAQRKGLFRSALARGDQAVIEDAAERLGRLMAMAGRADEAIPILSADPTTTPSRMRLLGDLQLAANRLLDADASFKTAMDADEAAAKPSANVIASDRLRRLLVAERRGQVHAPPEWFKPTLTSLAKAPLADLPLAIKGLSAGSELLVSLGQPTAAVVPLTDAAALLRKNRPKVRTPRPPAKPKTPVVAKGTPPTKAAPPPKPAKATVKTEATPLSAEVASRLAAAYLASGDHAAALLAADTELEPAVNSLGPGDAGVTLLRMMAAGGALGQGDVDAASKHASQALAYGLPRPDDAWEEVLTGIFDELAVRDANTDWRGELIAARSKQFGQTHPHVATAWGLFGAARLAAGDWPAAVTCFSKGLDANRTALGENHPEVAASLALLAHAQRMSGDAPQGARTAEEAVGILERSVGRNHPATLEVVDVLVAARLQARDMNGVAELLERLCASEAMAEPVRRAYHLTRYAEVTASNDKAASRSRLQAVMALPCWNPDAELTTADRRTLADTAAYVTRVYRMLGEDDAGKTTLLRARSIALRLDESGTLIARIERLATPDR